MLNDFGLALESVFGPSRVSRDAPLKGLTTFRVGGPADWLVDTHSSEEILTALALARQAGVSVTVLGGGSNVLIADAGVRGLVIRPRRGDIHRLDDTRVRADAAVTINGLVRWTIVHRAAGLEAWAGTPGTVGGAIWGNAHFGGRLMGELVIETRLAAPDGTVSSVPATAMQFGYDRSRLQGPVLAHKFGADIISDATPLGALQVPASGQPVLLMADRQTTGGYPKIATVITADIGIAGQLGPGDTISFEVCSRRSAMAALIAQERALMALEGC